MSHLVVSITVYMLAQSQGSSYMHVIARLCRMCYEVLRAHACSACAHASQLLCLNVVLLLYIALG